MKKQRYIVYKVVEELAMEGTYEDVCKYLNCKKSAISQAFRRRKRTEKFGEIRGHRVYKQEEGEEYDAE